MNPFDLIISAICSILFVTFFHRRIAKVEKKKSQKETEAESLREEASEWQGRYDATCKNYLHVFNLCLEIQKENRHLQSVLAKKNRRIERMKEVWKANKLRMEGRKAGDYVADLDYEEYVELLAKANELHTEMQKRGLICIGPIETRL